VRENVCPLFSLVKRESRHEGAVGNRIGELYKRRGRKPGPGSCSTGQAEQVREQITSDQR